MTDYYLRTADQETMQATLRDLGDTATIDEIGVMYRVLDDETAEALPGYHANVRSPEEIVWPDGIEQLNPETPWRVFA
jgi:hypothetical protein